MNILKEVFKHEVFPALGCTEPIAVAYAASAAGELLHDDSLQDICITVDPGVYKNGIAVTVPNTNGKRGNLIAGVLGALIKRPKLKMEILKHTSDELLCQADALIQDKKARLICDNSKKRLYIEVVLHTESESARAIIKYGHTNVVLLEKNGVTVFRKEQDEKHEGAMEYKKILQQMKIVELLDLIETMDEDDYAYLQLGIDMNLTISEKGQKLQKVGYYLADLAEKGYLVRDVFASSKIMTASAADARMAGVSCPVMASGGSGNQGVVAILLPYNVGKHFKVKEHDILKSVALSHLLNSYIKCYIGDLSPVCGCAIAAGVGATAAIVYQLAGKNIDKITLAINNLLSDLGGMLCDGAKGGCALKVVSATDSAIRSAYMAMNNHGINAIEGFVGRTVEETILNFSKISDIGMAKVDDTMIKIMMEKSLTV
ncbi:hypothetical protein CSB45_09780 [candidate division KSB3 bacterium]|uniref:UPF0597 protein CSB45_09780 n=1 Tax=candidate division KSB3 bacterium TaxID=2044937 RepID=A0A2G6E433_9BACT|nr:MAG: hypothetical protein CSB45_09780 [candidate division KSB3 bacterium]PIE29389.1 MAG: hypothetical protein CSA57_09315 [candidate division KSB3 bacterium]